MSNRDKDEWRRLFAEKKSRQLNNGPCASVIVDCDCDWCLEQETDKEIRLRSEAGKESQK